MTPQSGIHRLVSLTFDEDPKVRKDAAQELGRIDDPAALFALIELSYDKDGNVKKAAQEILKQKKAQEQEVMSFAELFSAGRKFAEPKKAADLQKHKDRVLSPITQLFEKRLGKEKAEAVQSRMMPTIEKIYSKITDKRPRSGEGERQVMQEFLTSYLEAIESIEQPGSDGTAAYQVEEVEPSLEEDLEEVGRVKAVGKIDRESLELVEEETLEPGEAAVAHKLPDSIFKKAYETMMLSDGDERVMRKEMKRMLQEVERDVRLAFHLARKHFKETRITQLPKLRDGMRNINTEVLNVQQREHIEYPKGKQKKLLTRLVVSDAEGGEGVVYLFDDRGAWIQEGMEIRMVRGHVKSFEFSSETALTIGKKGNVYIVV